MQRINFMIDDKKYRVLKKHCRYMSTTISKLIRDLVLSEVDKNCCCKDVSECKRCTNITNSSECIECANSDNLIRCYQSIHCSDSSFLYRCFGMKNCNFCIDCESLEGVEYYYKNVPITPMEFKQIEKLILDKEVCWWIIY